MLKIKDDTFRRVLFFITDDLPVVFLGDGKFHDSVGWPSMGFNQTLQNTSVTLNTITINEKKKFPIATIQASSLTEWFCAWLVQDLVLQEQNRQFNDNENSFKCDSLHAFFLLIRDHFTVVLKLFRLSLARKEFVYSSGSQAVHLIDGSVIM